MSLYSTLVCSGAGVRGLLFLGALEYIEEQQLADFKYFSGASAGALVAFLCAAGYTAKEIQNIVYKKDLSTLTKVSLKNLLTKFGLDTGDAITDFLGELIEKKGLSRDITFKLFYELKKKDILVFATNLKTQSLTQFDRIQSPNLKIIDAIRMSISIPFYFTAKKFRDGIHVDGALLEHFPINETERFVTCNNDNKHHHTLGLCVKWDEESQSGPVTNFLSYCQSLVSCLTRTNFETYKESEKTKILYFESNAQMLNFGMSLKEKRDLVLSGYNLTLNFFKEGASEASVAETEAN